VTWLLKLFLFSCRCDIIIIPLRCFRKLFTHVELIEEVTSRSFACLYYCVIYRFKGVTGILAELREMSKTLDETIRLNTERKASMDNLIMALSAKDEDMVEGNEDVDDNDDQDKSEVAA
jgi:hypothetical protein